MHPTPLLPGFGKHVGEGYPNPMLRRRPPPLERSFPGLSGFGAPRARIRSTPGSRQHRPGALLSRRHGLRRSPDSTAGLYIRLRNPACEPHRRTCGGLLHSSILDAAQSPANRPAIGPRMYPVRLFPKRATPKPATTNATTKNTPACFQVIMAAC